MARDRNGYSRLPTEIELTHLTDGRMTRSLALETLDLKGTLASPKDFETKARRLLDENKDDLSRTTAIHAARSRLQADHRAAVQDMRDTLTDAFADFQQVLGPYVESEPGYEHAFNKYGRMLYEQGVALCQALEQPSADIQYAELAYRVEIDKIINTASQAVPNQVKISYTAKLRTLILDICLAYENTRDDVLEDVFDAVDLFRDEFSRYLEDIIDLKTYERNELDRAHQQAQQPLLHAPRYERDLGRLHRQLKKLGDHYFAELRKEGANIQALQIEFTRGFQLAVSEAKQAFEKTPGIWLNLHPLLQIVCACTIIPALIILYCEKTEDRYRLFHGAPKGEIDVASIWKEWHMDIMPDLSGESSRPRHQ